MNVLDAPTRARVLDLWDEGKGLREIERLTGVHRETVGQLVGGMRGRVKIRKLLQEVWTWLEERQLEFTDCEALVDIQLEVYRCYRHPHAVVFEDVDDEGCRFCVKEQLQAHHRRHKDAGDPIVPPRRPASSIKIDSTVGVSPLIAPPANPRLSMRANKTQTIINIVTGLGPISREKVFEHMAGLFGDSYERAKTLTQPLLWQITGRRGRIREDADGNLVAPKADDEGPEETRTIDPIEPEPETIGSKSETIEPDPETIEPEPDTIEPIHETPPPTVTLKTKRTKKAIVTPMTPTRASVERAERAKRSAQNLEKDDERLRICKDAVCARPDDVSLGGFQTPSGATCSRCGAKINAGNVVLVRSRKTVAAVS